MNQLPEIPLRLKSVLNKFIPSLFVISLLNYIKIGGKKHYENITLCQLPACYCKITNNYIIT